MPLEDNRIPVIIAQLEKNLELVVTKAGLMVEAEAKKRARVRTGYMRNQIRWTPDDRNPLEGEVVGGADYTIYNEYGTVYMAAQPMFWPAVMVVRPTFELDVKKAVHDAVEE